MSLDQCVAHCDLRIQELISDVSGQSWQCPTGQLVIANTVYQIVYSDVSHEQMV